jgi:hypothetical protein
MPLLSNEKSALARPLIWFEVMAAAWLAVIIGASAVVIAANCADVSPASALVLRLEKVDPR